MLNELRLFKDQRRTKGCIYDVTEMISLADNQVSSLADLCPQLVPTRAEVNNVADRVAVPESTHIIGSKTSDVDARIDIQQRTN